jgi:uncharacterized repeat protein (TIGR03843 family)
MTNKSFARKKTEREVSQILTLLACGEMEIQDLVPWSSNYTYLVNVSQGDQELLAIYKPDRGERPLWDFPSGTLSKREVASYTLSAALDWPHVPPSVLRDGPEGTGVVQLFIDFVDRQHFFTMRDEYREDMKRIAVFDAIVNNTDRKGGHILLGEDGHVWCIDHGVTFHEFPKLRTVIWDFTDQPIPKNLLSDLVALQARLKNANDELTMRMIELISRREIRALRQRIDELVQTGIYPSPSNDWPPVPWPPL